GVPQMDLGQAIADPPHQRRHIGDGFREENLEIAGRAAFAGQPLGLGGKRPDGRPMDGAPEQAEGRAQAAQRDAGLVDAVRAGALQHRSAVFQEVGMAAGRDVPQSGLWIGVGTKSRLGQWGHA
ncbi:MAG: hypothetical protein AAB398_08195, partial [Pseudomonadota bacterium]